MKNHLKRIPAPRTWILARKENTFVVRPSPSGHQMDQGLPLGVIIRDNLNFASTMSEVKKILNSNEVLVNGKRRKNHRFLVGLFDNLVFPNLNKFFQVGLDLKGRIVVNEVSEKDSKVKFSKIMGKTAIKKGKIQFNLHDGTNLVSDKKAKVGDTLVLELPSLEIKQVLELKPGVEVLLAKGNNGGSFGELKKINGNRVTCLVNDEEIETAKKYLFAVMRDKK
jgi:small subunit ribosomal protein S4e